MSNIVAIVGRPNVGKSTFFNRMVGSRTAIVHETSGVTRDRNYGVTDWNGVEFSIIDTGGYVFNSDDVFELEIRKQVVLAIQESDVILFLVDVQSGVSDMDTEVAHLLRKCKKPVLMVVNKVDNNLLHMNANEFYSLGLGELFCISSVNGHGTGDLLDAVVAAFPNKTEEKVEETIPRLAVVGRPNVGKSSFINALIGEDRNIVTPIAGTTRDSLNTRYTKFGHDFVIVDTAGIRKKAKVSEDLEFYSVMRSIRTIEYSDICLLLLDGTRGIEAQDVNIFRVIERNQKGVVILVNKWDIVEKDHKSTEKFTKTIHEKFAPFVDIPIIYISALTKQRIHKALEEAMHVYENRSRKIITSVFNEFLQETIENYPPPASKGKYVKIKYGTQLHMHYPAFTIFCNLPQYIKEPYKRYVENRLREKFDFKGSPVQLFFRQK